MTKREVIDFKKFIRKDLNGKGLKQCSVCYHIKPLEKFEFRNNVNDKKQSDCCDCRKHIIGRAKFKSMLRVDDYYVKTYARASIGISPKDFPPEALEIVRQQILTGRKLKQIKHEKTVK